MRSASDSKRFVVALLELGRHHNAAILRELVGGSRRYTDLLSVLAHIPEPTLGASLRELDGDGLVRRRVDSGPPLRVLYELTPLGEDLAPSLGAIEAWARRVRLDV
ncbi:MAG: hypothetical protein NVS3B17_08560 [Vulcanimicrobiaceae bacterium]